MEEKDEGRPLQGSGEGAMVLSSSSRGITGLRRETSLSSDEQQEEEEDRAKEVAEISTESWPLGTLQGNSTFSSCSPTPPLHSRAYSSSPSVSFRGDLPSRRGLSGQEAVSSQLHVENGARPCLIRYDLSPLPPRSPRTSSPSVGEAPSCQSPSSPPLSAHSIRPCLVSVEKSSSRRILQETINKRCDEVERFLRRIRSASSSSSPVCSAPQCSPEGMIGRYPAAATEVVVERDREAPKSPRLPLSRAEDEEHEEGKKERGGGLEEGQDYGVSTCSKGRMSRDCCGFCRDESLESKVPLFLRSSSSSSSTSLCHPFASSDGKEERPYRHVSSRKRKSRGSNFSRGGSGACGRRHVSSFSSPSPLRDVLNTVLSFSNSEEGESSRRTQLSTRPIPKTPGSSSSHGTNRSSSSSRKTCRASRTTSRPSPVDFPRAGSSSTSARYTSKFSSSVLASPSRFFSVNNELSPSLSSSISRGALVSPSSSTRGFNQTLPFEPTSSSHVPFKPVSSSPPPPPPLFQSSDYARLRELSGGNVHKEGNLNQRGRSPSRFLQSPLSLTTVVETHSQSSFSSSSSSRGIGRSKIKGRSGGGQGRRDMIRKRSTAVSTKTSGEEGHHREEILAGTSALSQARRLRERLAHSLSSGSAPDEGKSSNSLPVAKQGREEDAFLRSPSGSGRGLPVSMAKKGRRSVSISCGDRSSASSLSSTRRFVSRTVSTSCGGGDTSRRPVISHPLTSSSCSSSAFLLSSLPTDQGSFSTRTRGPRPFLSPKASSRPHSAGTRHSRRLTGTAHSRISHKREDVSFSLKKTGIAVSRFAPSLGRQSPGERKLPSSHSMSSSSLSCTPKPGLLLGSGSPSGGEEKEATSLVTERREEKERWEERGAGGEDGEEEERQDKLSGVSSSGSSSSSRKKGLPRCGVGLERRRGCRLKNRSAMTGMKSLETAGRSLDGSSPRAERREASGHPTLPQQKNLEEFPQRPITQKLVGVSASCSSSSSSPPLLKKSFTFSPPSRLSLLAGRLSVRKAEDSSRKVARGRRRRGEHTRLSGLSSFHLRKSSPGKKCGDQLHCRDDFRSNPSGQVSPDASLNSLPAVTRSKRRALSSSTAAPRRGKRMLSTSSPSLDEVREEGKARQASSSPLDFRPYRRDLSQRLPGARAQQEKEKEKESGLRRRRLREGFESRSNQRSLPGLEGAKHGSKTISRGGHVGLGGGRTRSAFASPSHPHCQRTCYSVPPSRAASSSSFSSRLCFPSSSRLLVSSAKLDRIHRMQETLSEQTGSSSSLFSRMRREVLLNSFERKDSSPSSSSSSSLSSMSPSEILTLLKIMSRVVSADTQRVPPSCLPLLSACASSSSAFASHTQLSSTTEMSAPPPPSPPPPFSPHGTLLAPSTSPPSTSRELRTSSSSSPEFSFSSGRVLSDSARSSFYSSEDGCVPSRPARGGLPGFASRSSSPTSTLPRETCPPPPPPPQSGPSSSGGASLDKDVVVSRYPSPSSSRYLSSKSPSSHWSRSMAKTPERGLLVASSSASVSSSESPSLPSSCRSSPTLTRSVLDPSKYTEQTLRFSTVTLCAASPPSSSSKQSVASGHSSSKSDSEESAYSVPHCGAGGHEGAKETSEEKTAGLCPGAGPGDRGGGEGEKKEKEKGAAGGEESKGQQGCRDPEEAKAKETTADRESPESFLHKNEEQDEAAKWKSRTVTEEQERRSLGEAPAVEKVGDAELRVSAPSSTTDNVDHGLCLGDKTSSEDQSASWTSSSRVDAEASCPSSSPSPFSRLKSGVVLPRLPLETLLESKQSGSLLRQSAYDIPPPSSSSFSSSSFSSSSSLSSSSSVGRGDGRRSDEGSVGNRTATTPDRKRSSVRGTEEPPSQRTLLEHGEEEDKEDTSAQPRASESSAAACTRPSSDNNNNNTTANTHPSSSSSSSSEASRSNDPPRDLDVSSSAGGGVRTVSFSPPRDNSAEKTKPREKQSPRNIGGGGGGDDQRSVSTLDVREASSPGTLGGSADQRESAQPSAQQASSPSPAVEELKASVEGSPPSAFTKRHTKNEPSPASSTSRTGAVMGRRLSAGSLPQASRAASSSPSASSVTALPGSKEQSGRGGGGQEGEQGEEKNEESVGGESLASSPSSLVASKAHPKGRRTSAITATPKQAPPHASGTVDQKDDTRKDTHKSSSSLSSLHQVRVQQKGHLDLLPPSLGKEDGEEDTGRRGDGGEEAGEQQETDLPKVTISQSPPPDSEDASASSSSKPARSLRRGSASPVAPGASLQNASSAALPARGGSPATKGRTRQSVLSPSPPAAGGGGLGSPRTLASAAALSTAAAAATGEASRGEGEAAAAGGGGGGGGGGGKLSSPSTTTATSGRRLSMTALKKRVGSLDDEPSKKSPSPASVHARRSSAVASSLLKTSSGGSEAGGGGGGGLNAGGTNQRTPTTSTTTSALTSLVKQVARDARRASKVSGQPSSPSSPSSSRAVGGLARSFSPSSPSVSSSSSPPSTPAPSSSSVAGAALTGGGLGVKTGGGGALGKRRVTVALSSPSSPGSASPPSSPPSVLPQATSSGAPKAPGRRKTAFAASEASSLSSSPQAKARGVGAGAGGQSKSTAPDEGAASGGGGGGTTSERRKTTALGVPGTGGPRSLLSPASQTRSPGEETLAGVSSSSSASQQSRVSSLAHQRRKTTTAVVSAHAAAATTTTAGGLTHPASSGTSSDFTGKAGAGVPTRGRGKSVLVTASSSNSTGSAGSTSTSTTATSTAAAKLRRTTRVLRAFGAHAAGKKKSAGGGGAVDGKKEAQEGAKGGGVPSEGTRQTKKKKRSSADIIRDINGMIRRRLEQERKEEQEAEEASSSKHYAVADLPLPIRRIQPRVAIPAGPFPPIRDAPELEATPGLRLLQAALSRRGGGGQRTSCTSPPLQSPGDSFADGGGGGCRGQLDGRQIGTCGGFVPFESALYSLCMEVLLVTPLDMKNMRRWVHQSLAEVERERKELIDVFDYLRILPGFYMTDTPRKNMGSSPLEFFRRFVDDRKWKEKWGKGWLGRDGKFLPSLPRERLLHAFFFAEGIEGGPDYECKMMEREDKLMRRFLQLEALSKEREKMKKRLLEEEKELFVQVLYKKKRFLQLEYMVDCLVEAILSQQQSTTYCWLSSPLSSSSAPRLVAYQSSGGGVGREGFPRAVVRSGSLSGALQRQAKERAELSSATSFFPFSKCIPFLNQRRSKLEEAVGGGLDTGRSEEFLSSSSSSSEDDGAEASVRGEGTFNQSRQGKKTRGRRRWGYSLSYSLERPPERSPKRMDDTQGDTTVSSSYFCPRESEFVLNSLVTEEDTRADSSRPSSPSDLWGRSPVTHSPLWSTDDHSPYMYSGVRTPGGASLSPPKKSHPLSHYSSTREPLTPFSSRDRLEKQKTLYLLSPDDVFSTSNNFNTCFCYSSSFSPSSSSSFCLKREMMPPLLPSVDCIRHLFRTKQFGELNRLFVCLEGRSIPEIWLAMDREEEMLHKVYPPFSSFPWWALQSGQLYQTYLLNHRHPATTTAGPSTLTEGGDLHAPAQAQSTGETPLLPAKSRAEDSESSLGGEERESSATSSSEPQEETAEIETKKGEGGQEEGQEGNKGLSKKEAGKDPKAKAKGQRRASQVSPSSRSSQSPSPPPALRSQNNRRASKASPTTTTTTASSSSRTGPSASSSLASSLQSEISSPSPEKLDDASSQERQGEANSAFRDQRNRSSKEISQQGEEEEDASSSSAFLCPPPPPSRGVSSSSMKDSSAVKGQRRKSTLPVSPPAPKKTAGSKRRATTVGVGSDMRGGMAGVGLSTENKGGKSNESVGTSRTPKAAKSDGALVKRTRSSLVQFGATTAVKEKKGLTRRGGEEEEAERQGSRSGIALLKKTSGAVGGPKQSKRRQTEFAPSGSLVQKRLLDKGEKILPPRKVPSSSSSSPPPADDVASSRRATAIG